MASKQGTSPKIKSRIPYTLILGLLLLSAGLFLVLYSNIDKFKFSPNEQSVISSPAFDSSQEAPVKIYIPKIGRFLPIEAGKVVENRWEVSERGVSYLTSTPAPGQLGNTVMYGHNRDAILGRMQNLVSGDKIYVLGDKGTIYKYTVFETKEITPQQVEILNQTEDKRLTVYTCSGFLDQSRFVVVASLN